jgi:predicted TIM-barrel fold metal-dependent hydrolase
MEDGQPGSPLQEIAIRYRKNFYFDILVHDEKARRFLVDSWGVDNLAVGSNYSGWNRADEFQHLETLGLTQDEKGKLSHLNAERLFNLPTG